MIKELLEFKDKEDIINDCIENGESLLGMKNGTIQYGIQDASIFQMGEPGMFIPKIPAIIFNKSWLDIAEDDDIIFVTFTLVKNYFQYLSTYDGCVDESGISLKWKNSKNDKDLREQLDKDAIEFAKTAMEFFYNKKYKKI